MPRNDAGLSEQQKRAAVDEAHALLARGESVTTAATHAGGTVGVSKTTVRRWAESEGRPLVRATGETENAVRAHVSMSLQRQRDRSQDLLRVLDVFTEGLVKQAKAGAQHIDLTELGKAANILATLQKLDFELFMRIGRGREDEQAGVDDEQYRREALEQWEKDREAFGREPADSPAP